MRSCLGVGAVLCSGLLLGPGASALNVRVLVVSAPQLTVRLAPAAPAAPALGGPASPLGTAPLPAQAWTVGVSGAQLTLNGQPTGSGSLYLPPAPGSVVEIAGKAFRGGVQLRAENGGVQGINVVDLEDYLRGVVPAEMPASWPAAALQAQAVIARTYVTARINPATPYDTCATESCQVYGGVAAEKPQTDAAVAATRAQVVAFGGRAASTYFSSDSGGFTASSAEVWGKDLPYLTAKADPFSADGPRAHWRLEVPLSRVQDVAGNYGARVGALRSVTVTRVSESGRPLEIRLTGANGSAVLTGANAGGFVRALGASGTRVSVSGLNPLVLEGSGSGHGVGLSQYGALGLARAGYSHLHVLGFYYPGTLLSTLAQQGPGPAAVLTVGTPFPVPGAAEVLALARPAGLTAAARGAGQ
ncbi:SpoIID/LytB domain-containing protein [Deinococcus taeanensis]|uniref:SpoIID/LytB domain-containing protein n=1 Tax=Deinococcus taeanensis TaxID=2737050 RepID=UPI001CDCC94B|nr:SpoIID/LytB domain-containing protein [Deinococcus taeanensis]UBV42418.1 SpoIID/LytB domain-containing protein [Deinococcus taeanensis]